MAQLGSTTHRLVLALLVSATLVAGGCGSSNSESSSTEPAQVQGRELANLPKAPEPAGAPPRPASSSSSDQRAYLEAIFADTQALWRREFAESGERYTEARLVLFSRAVRSTGCGEQADVGPFYCHDNRTIYLDLRFFRMLLDRFGIGGFAPAYINGHEFGHHVQDLIGLTGRVAAANRQDPRGENDRSVRLELQADCLAGVWAHSVYTRGELTADDMSQALKAAAVVGDDFQMEMAGHKVDSTLWTHGSSEQRQRWLKTGFESGEPGACDTFTAQSL